MWKALKMRTWNHCSWSQKNAVVFILAPQVRRKTEDCTHQNTKEVPWFFSFTFRCLSSSFWVLSPTDGHIQKHFFGYTPKWIKKTKNVVLEYVDMLLFLKIQSSYPLRLVTKWATTIIIIWIDPRLSRKSIEEMFEIISSDKEWMQRYFRLSCIQFFSTICCSL